MKATLNRHLKLMATTACVLLGSARCASVTNMHSAKTLAEGESSHTLGVTYGNVKLNDDSGSIDATAPAIDYMYRYGLTSQDELGLKIAGTGTYFMGDYKRGLVTSGSVLVSAGLGLGGTQYSVGDVSTKIVDIYVPLYTDFVVSDMFSLIAAPKYVLRFVDSEKFSQAGGSFGFKWGKESGMIAEVGYLHQFGNVSVNYWQVSSGFFF
ncbi:MAG: hypothetical protein JST16_05955 [Bdellovibrionales bacterium]|nr:hypothetical protein [Bdellovibrionales bacterium]